MTPHLEMAGRGWRVQWHPEQGFTVARQGVQPQVLEGLDRALQEALDNCPNGSHWPPAKCARYAVEEVLGAAGLSVQAINDAPLPPAPDPEDGIP